MYLCMTFLLCSLSLPTVCSVVHNNEIVAVPKNTLSPLILHVDSQLIIRQNIESVLKE